MLFNFVNPGPRHPKSDGEVISDHEDRKVVDLLGGFDAIATSVVLDDDDDDDVWDDEPATT